MNRNETVDIDFDELVHDTDMAWLISIDSEKVWLPKSECELDEHDQVAQVPEWLAIEKGLV